MNTNTNLKKALVIGAGSLVLTLGSAGANAGVFCPGFINDVVNIAGTIFGGGPPDPGCIGDKINAGLGNPIRLPQPQPQPLPPIGRPVGFPAPQPFPMQVMGNFCYTPYGRFGPGPMNPVGSFCNTPAGPGSVGQ